MSANKPETIDAYISGFPEPLQKLMQQLRATIKKAAPGAEEKISYAIPTFYLEGNLVHFAASKNHIGFYPAPSGLKAFAKEVAKFKNSKGAVQFPFDKPLPLSLITKIVKYRVKENILITKRKKLGNK
ncbi:MAG: iron chaperone [Chitinophagales bacterium]